jgi:hypothetical protein
VKRSIQFGIIVMATAASLATTARASEPEFLHATPPAASCSTSSVKFDLGTGAFTGTAENAEVPLGFSVNCDQQINSLSLTTPANPAHTGEAVMIYVTGLGRTDLPPDTSAQVTYPLGIAVDSAGNIYIADPTNNTIRKVSGGIITTVAGNGAPTSAGFLSSVWKDANIADTNNRQWWTVGLTIKDRKRAVFEFTPQNKVLQPYDDASMLFNIPPIEAVSVGFASNLAETGPTRQIVITDPFGTKRPKLLAVTKQQMKSDCGLPRPKHPFALHEISRMVSPIVFVNLTNAGIERHSVLSCTPFITPLRT